jgi:hypothetical protein
MKRVIDDRCRYARRPRFACMASRLLNRAGRVMANPLVPVTLSITSSRVGAINEQCIVIDVTLEIQNMARGTAHFAISR